MNLYNQKFGMYDMYQVLIKNEHRPDENYKRGFEYGEKQKRKKKRKIK